MRPSLGARFRALESAVAVSVGDMKRELVLFYAEFALAPSHRVSI
jgi:hypothetical protein